MTINRILNQMYYSPDKVEIYEDNFRRLVSWFLPEDKNAADYWLSQKVKWFHVYDSQERLVLEVIL